MEFVGSIARVRTSVALTPFIALIATQLPPLSILMNAPWSCVPAKRKLGVTGSMAMTGTTSVLNPLALQVAPPLVLLNTPRVVAA